MAIFDGKAAEPIAGVPVLFKHYVETIFKGREGLKRDIGEVIGHLMGDPATALVLDPSRQQRCSLALEETSTI
jgi:hypothetical protein